MPRPRICRRVRFRPNSTYFKPAGVRIVDLVETILSFEESEAIRLIDFEETSQDKAAKQMEISQPTLSRLLKSARKKISDSIINGKAIKIQGGNYKMVKPRGKDLSVGRGRGFSGRGRMGGFTAGPSGNCICPKCKYTETHQTGIPCYQKKCPKCQGPMTRG